MYDEVEEKNLNRFTFEHAGDADAGETHRREKEKTERKDTLKSIKASLLVNLS